MIWPWKRKKKDKVKAELHPYFESPEESSGAEALAEKNTLESQSVDELVSQPEAVERLQDIYQYESSERVEGAYVVRAPLTMNDPSKTVVLAEDDSDLAYLLELLFEREGLEVLWAQNGREMSEFLSQIETPPLLLVLDIMLPFVDGLSLLESARQRWEKLPIIMLTSKSDSATISKALGLGASDYLTKPFQPEELLSRVHRLVQAS